MKWSDVRKMYPDKFVLLKNLGDHTEGNIKYIDEVAIVKVIDDENEAGSMLVRCKGDTFVYHTGKEELSMEIVNMPILRGKIK